MGTTIRLRIQQLQHQEWLHQSSLILWFITMLLILRTGSHRNCERVMALFFTLHGATKYPSWFDTLQTALLSNSSSRETIASFLHVVSL
ncbi:8851_t:CDS:2, partial [Funneliformis geosporum]